MRKRFLDSLPEKQRCMLQYARRYHRLPNLRTPQTFNEKMIWIKLNHRDPLMVRCADKLAVRDYVAAAVSDDILVPLHGIWEDPDDIPYDSLPDQFVLKATHASGWGVLLCRSRDSFDRLDANARLAQWLRTNFYDGSREWHYRDIPPKVICEEFLTEDGITSAPDYKLFCFHGEPVYIQVDRDRFGNHTQSWYDTEWNPVDVQLKKPSVVRPRSRPAFHDCLLDAARRLAAPFGFVRVDLYAVAEHVFFGELTFNPHNGLGKFSPRSFDKVFGGYLDLARLKNRPSLE